MYKVGKKLIVGHNKKTGLQLINFIKKKKNCLGILIQGRSQQTLGGGLVNM